MRADRILQRRVLPIGHRRSVDGIPVTTLPRTLFDLAGVLPRARVERALDTCLARRWVALPALQRVLADLATRGRAGTAVMRELLEARGGGYVPPASALEARFLNIMRAAGLAEPQRELELGDDSSPIGRVEFVYASQRLLVEVDGDWYHTSLTDQRSDRARDRRFVAEGWRVLRLDRNLLVNDPEEVVRLVRNALRLAA